MKRDGWHILRDGDVLTVSRRVPPRWDIVAETVVPSCARLRLATQIRQDLWRLLRKQRGFAPIVEITRLSAGLRVRAGGRIEGPVNRHALEARIAALLSHRGHRNRWVACAGGRRGAQREMAE